MGFADRKSYPFRLTVNGADGQALEANWRDRRRLVIARLLLSNESTTTASIVKIYDKSTTSGAPATRGDSTSNPLLEFIVPASNTLVFEENKLPREFFMAGITANASITPLQMNIEVMDD